MRLLLSFVMVKTGLRKSNNPVLASCLFQHHERTIATL